MWVGPHTVFRRHDPVMHREIEVASIVALDDGGYRWIVHMGRMHPLADGTLSSRREAARAVRRAINRYAHITAEPDTETMQ